VGTTKSKSYAPFPSPSRTTSLIYHIICRAVRPLPMSVAKLLYHLLRHSPWVGEGEQVLMECARGGDGAVRRVAEEENIWAG
jgi:hypothetical protein